MVFTRRGGLEGTELSKGRGRETKAKNRAALGDTENELQSPL